MEISLVFPPQHDPAFPHSSLPHIKSYLLKHNSTVNVRCDDLNQKFYDKFVFKKDGFNQLYEIRKKLEQEADIYKGVGLANEFEQLTSKKCSEWSKENSGYSLSLRTLDTPFNRHSVNDVNIFARSNTPFDELYDSYLDTCKADVIGINSVSYTHLTLPTKA